MRGIAYIVSFVVIVLAGAATFFDPDLVFTSYGNLGMWVMIPCLWALLLLGLYLKEGCNPKPFALPLFLAAIVCMGGDLLVWAYYTHSAWGLLIHSLGIVGYMVAFRYLPVRPPHIPFIRAYPMSIFFAIALAAGFYYTLSAANGFAAWLLTAYLAMGLSLVLMALDRWEAVSTDDFWRGVVGAALLTTAQAIYCWSHYHQEIDMGDSLAFVLWAAGHYFILSIITQGALVKEKKTAELTPS